MLHLQNLFYRIVRDAVFIALSSLCTHSIFAQSWDYSVAVIQSDAAVRAEILKSTTAQAINQSGLEEYRQDLLTRLGVFTLQTALAQPSTMCQMSETQNAVFTGAYTSRIKAGRANAKMLGTSAINSNSARATTAAHDNTNNKFCSETDSEQGICKLSTNPKFANFSGADVDALFLFQSKEGPSTYDGDKDGAQVDAANSYIQRVVFGVPPENVANGSTHLYRSSQAARAHAELARRYQAILSMSAYSLNRIKESRNPQK
jgi:hypothetical protein